MGMCYDAGRLATATAARVGLSLRDTPDRFTFAGLWSRAPTGHSLFPRLRRDSDAFFGAVPWNGFTNYWFLVLSRAPTGRSRFPRLRRDSDGMIDEILNLVRIQTAPLKIAITGGRHTGKTSVLRKIALAARPNGLDMAGFTENALFDHETRLGYEFENLITGERCPVATKNPDAGYTFHESAWIWAENALKASQSHPILIVDELGRLEAQNLGIMPALRKSLIVRPRHLIAAVRGDALPQIESLIGTFDRVFVL